MRRRGFTIIELVIVITIMAILLTLGVVNLRGTQASARDSERTTKAESIAQHLEAFYTSSTDASVNTSNSCTGGKITYDKKYTVHTFTTSGTLTCYTSSITASVLVVGGGGGGGVSGAGDNRGGGGGGGGVVYNASITLSSGANSVVVGSGGAYSSAGSSSSFPGVTAVAGGGAGGSGAAVGGNGASGGGGGAQSSAGNYAGGTGSQGYNGGQGGTDSLTYRGGGGGGGAGGTGMDASLTGSQGGVGVSNSISGSAVYYGGGGGGGYSGSGSPGGIGGGGYGGVTVVGGGTGFPGSDGTPNSGGGGGGSGNGAITSGAGGSGVVIIRYPTPTTSNTYPSTLQMDSLVDIQANLRDIDIDSLLGPGTGVGASPGGETQSFAVATCSGVCVQTTSGVTPQPYTTNATGQPNFVYQPLHSDGTLCNDSLECTKFNLFYKTEVDNTVHVITSVDQ